MIPGISVNGIEKISSGRLISEEEMLVCELNYVTLTGINRHHLKTMVFLDLRLGILKRNINERYR